MNTSQFPFSPKKICKSATLRSTILGNENLPSLVLLHGFGSTSQIFDDLIPILIQHFQLHLIDLPGYGLNSDYLVDDVTEFCDDIANYLPHSAYLLGWSLGGLIATKIACIYPEKVSALLTVASSPYFMEMDNLTIKNSTIKEDWSGFSSHIFNQFKENIILNPQKTLENFMLLQVLGDKNRKQIFKKLKKQDLNIINNNILIQGLDWLEKIDLRDQLSQLSCPRLLILGENDAVVPSALQNKITNYDNKIIVKVIPLSGHLPFLSNTQLFCEAVLDFLQRLI